MDLHQIKLLVYNSVFGLKVLTENVFNQASLYNIPNCWIIFWFWVELPIVEYKLKLAKFRTISYSLKQNHLNICSVTNTQQLDFLW